MRIFQTAYARSGSRCSSVKWLVTGLSRESIPDRCNGIFFLMVLARPEPVRTYQSLFAQELECKARSNVVMRLGLEGVDFHMHDEVCIRKDVFSSAQQHLYCIVLNVNIMFDTINDVLVRLVSTCLQLIVKRTLSLRSALSVDGQ
jgi:hypothetical protein